MWRRDDDVTSSVRVEALLAYLYSSFFAYLRTKISVVQAQNSLSLFVDCTHARSIWPPACDWPHRHVQPSLPNMAACQSPPFNVAAEDIGERSRFDSRKILSQFPTDLCASRSLSEDWTTSVLTSIDSTRPSAKICHDSLPSKSRAICSSHSSESTLWMQPNIVRFSISVFLSLSLPLLLIHIIDISWIFYLSFFHVGFFSFACIHREVRARRLTLPQTNGIFPLDRLARK